MINTKLLLGLWGGILVTLLTGRDTIDFDHDWRFSLNNDKHTTVKELDDSDWRILSVPHDWAFEADYAENAAQGPQGGYKPGGVGWYRKSFKLPENWDGKHISIEFDAVYMNSEVWINETYLGKRPYGYISFSYDLTPHLKSGKNILSVRVDNSLEPSARWYHGCGIFGHVKLVATDAVSIQKDGVYITTSKLSGTSAQVTVETEIKNTLSSSTGLILETVILDPDGKVVTKESQVVSNESKVKQSFTIANPKLWDIHAPHLYQVSSKLKAGDIGDEIKTRFGIREISWKKETGFWLNGNNIKLKGVADHLEAGPVGAAYPDELLRWKLQQLKNMGCNSIRTAHNPQTPLFYDLCDEMGILVLNEIFDGWNKKAPQDYGKQAFKQWWERDLRAWLKRDRNHPSVIGWCIGNETGAGKGIGNIAQKIVAVCHELDPARLVTSGHANPGEMDIEGVNGHSEYQHFFQHQASKLTKPFVSTEAPHTWQVRGYYRTKTWLRDGMKRGVFPLPDLTEKEIFTYDWTAPKSRKNRKQIFNSSYDNATVRITARQNWELMRDLPWHSGHYRWTGIDYLGEAAYVHGGWPFRGFMGGALDLALFPKDLYYFYQSQWTKKPMVHILPHWTHPKMELGTQIPVWVYSNCDEVELFLNGKSLGKDKPGTKWNEMQCEWMVPWAPGTIEAVGYKDGQEILRTAHTTADTPAQLAFSVEGETCPIITVTQQDKNGVMNPYAENRIHYYLESDDSSARILSLESGSPVNTENNYGNTSRAAFFGLTRAFLHSSNTTTPLAVTIGAICGEKQLMTSDLITIDVKRLSIRGEQAESAFKILYSIDGSEPTLEYTEAFSVKPGSTIKADVYAGNKLLFHMEESFGPDQGIYWGNADDAAYVLGGDQAEDATFDRAIVSTKGQGYEGKGYLDFQDHKGAYVEWYQENDGSPQSATLSIRYSGKRPNSKGRPMRLTVNGEKQKLFLLNTEGYGTDWVNHNVPIKLNSGANQIRLSTIEAGGMCIDSIDIK